MNELKLRDLIGKTVSDVSYVKNCSLYIEFNDATFVEAAIGGEIIEEAHLEVDVGEVN